MVFGRFIRPIGIFLFIMAGLATLDWVIGTAMFGWPHRIINLEYYGDLRVVYQPPLPRTLIYLPCPGNGYGFLCGPWALFLIFVTLLAATVGLIVNFVYALASIGGWRDSSMPTRLWVQIFFAVASLALAIAHLWTWSIYLAPRSWGLPTGTLLMVEVVSSLMPPLFIVVCVATGWRLWRASSIS